jgi:hypothetical protein
MRAEKRRMGLLAAAVLGAMTFPAHADFQLFDNFNSYNTGTLSGQGGWVVPAQSSTVQTNVVETGLPDKEVQVIGAIPNYKALGGLTIPNASTAATVYFNFKMAAASTVGSGTTATNNNFNFIITDVTQPGDTAGSSEVQLNYDATQFPVGGSTTFRIRNAGAFPFATTGGTVASRVMPVANAQYNAWFVINNSTDTYQLYLQNDADSALATPKLITGIVTDASGNVTSSTSNFVFRNSGTGAVANDLITANFGNGTTVAANAVNFDDIYVDLAGSNTTNPVTAPEPASLALLGIGALALVGRRRRQA